MQIAVVGASGRTGAELCRVLVSRGHDVVAVVRDRARLSVPTAQVRVADGRSVDELTVALAGVDAVAWCVGPGRETEPDVMAASIRATVAAMRVAGVARLVAVTASGPFIAGDDPLTRYLAKPLLARLFRPTFLDMVAAEREIRDSGLDWTIVRPPRLLDGPGRGRYRSRRELNVRWGFTIRRADLARAMADTLVDPTRRGQTVSVAN
jgi:putative NADH-flavin reductase